MSDVVLDKVSFRHPRAAAPAVDGVDLALAGGSLVTLVGPSGCGKSSLLALIAGLATPNSGTIAIGGRSVLGLPPEVRGAVLMEQEPLLFPHMTVAGNVGFGLRMRGVAAADVERRVAGMLALVRLAGFGGRRPHELSGGQAQRVALARALVTEPAVLLLDEPFAALDPELRDEMRDLVLMLQRRTGTTMLLVTHDRTDAVALGNRMAVMLAGRVVQTGRPAEVFEHPGSAGAAQFLGFSNALTGTVRGWFFVTPDGDLAIEQAALDGPARAVFRPEAATIALDQAAGLRGDVQAVSYRGMTSSVTVRLTSGTVSVHADPAVAAGLSVGDRVRVAVQPASIRIFPVSG